MNHRGAALMTGLVLLAAISLLALVANNRMVLQHRQAANQEDRFLAAANAAIGETQARNWIISRADVERQSGCLSGCVQPVAIWNTGDLPRDPEFQSAAWWDTNAVASGFHPETGDPINTPPASSNPGHWIVEEIHYESVETSTGSPSPSGLAWYRILSRGTGRQPGSIAVTETIFARPWQGTFEAAAYPVGISPAEYCRQFNVEIPCGTLAWRRRR